MVFSDLFKNHTKITLIYLLFLAMEITLMEFHQDAYIELFLILSLPAMGIIVFMYALYKFKYHMNFIEYDEYKSKKTFLKVVFIFLGLNSSIISVHVAYEIVENIIGHGGHTSHAAGHGAEHGTEHSSDHGTSHDTDNKTEHGDKQSEAEHVDVKPETVVDPSNTSLKDFMHEKDKH